MAREKGQIRTESGQHMPQKIEISNRLTGLAGALGVLLASLLLTPVTWAQPADCAAAEGVEISVHCGGAPSATFDSLGRLWVAFVQNQQVFVSHSEDRGTSYSTPVAVNPVPEDAEFNGENRPKILVDRDGTVYVSWTLKTSPRFTGEIRFSRSTDSGRSFSEPVTINDDNLFTGHRFDSLFQTESGLLYLTWIDKRDLEASTEAGEAYPGAAIYYAVSRDQGKTFSRNYRVANNSCECCRIAMAPRGADNVMILWRQIFGEDTRDHAIAELTPDGNVLGLARATYDEWHINACPHHGPTLVKSEAADAYHLSWFSNGDLHQGIYYGRYDSAAGQTGQIMRVDGSPGAGHPFLQVYGGKVYLIWKGFDGSSTQLKLMTSSDDGASWSEPVTLRSTSRGSDHPLIVKHEQGLFLSWLTEESGYLFEPIVEVSPNRGMHDAD